MKTAEEIVKEFLDMVYKQETYLATLSDGFFPVRNFLYHKFCLVFELGYRQGLEQAAKIAEESAEDSNGLSGHMESNHLGYNAACDDITEAIRSLMPPKDPTP